MGSRKLARELTPLQVKRLTAPGLHFVGHVTGLALQVTPAGTRSWTLRYSVGPKRRDLGLGSYPSVTLADACTAAREARELLRRGVDPIEDARAKKSALAAAVASGLTFAQCASRYVDAHEAGWRSSKHAAQWRATLDTYATPILGKMRVADVQTAHVVVVLDPIWRTRTETASRVRGRIEAVLDWAKARGYRTGENPARWRGHLDKLLPARSKVARVKHHAALPYAKIGDFMVKLRKAEGIGARALELAILCAARSGEVRGARWSEVDLDAGIWTVPGTRMKAGKEHRVPLSGAAVELLRALPRVDDCDLVFPGARNRPMSDATLGAVLKRMKVDVTAHGFRSTFRDWAAETTAYPSEVVEMALAHTIDNKVEAAYRRGDLMERRRRLAEDWARYCATPSTTAKVHPIRRRAS
ncbi:MAG TPA: integrase arm-type DNA-binding domain-containing protein [Zeimonas sp.]